MKMLNVDDAAPQFKRGAAIDAQQKHAQYWPTHTPARQAESQTLRDLAHNAYGLLGSRVYLTAREKFITVKVDKPSVRAQWAYPNELAQMNAFVKANSIEVVATKKNLEFRLPK